MSYLRPDVNLLLLLMPSSPPPSRYLANLQARGLLTAPQAAAIAAAEAAHPFSLHYELRTFLYLGITLLAGGLGVLIYQNIDSIGHSVVVTAITAIMLTCFAYAARHRAPFSWGPSPKTSIGADYLLLLGCLLFVVLEGYLQYQYNFFGSRYGVATALPALVFIPLAYWFDHRGVLAMGLTALASWLGVTASPMSVLANNDFWNDNIRTAALGLGIALMAVGLFSEYRSRKAHFAFTYLLLGCNLALIPLAIIQVKAAFDEDLLLVLFAGCMTLVLCASLLWYARRAYSYWFLVLAAGYAYVAACTILSQALMALPRGLRELAWMAFFPLSAAAAVLFFVNIKKIMRANAGPPAGAPPGV